jgi:hypothetical protein
MTQSKQLKYKPIKLGNNLAAFSDVKNIYSFDLTNLFWEFLPQVDSGSSLQLCLGTREIWET